MKRNTGKNTQNRKDYQFPSQGDDFIDQVKKNEFCYVTIGDCAGYECFGINANDILLYRYAAKNDENQLTVWQPFDVEGGYVGFAFDNFGDISIDRGEGRIERFKKNRIKLLGVVVGIVKSFDAQKITGSTGEPDPVELTVCCQDCKKEQIGDKKFLIAEGWEFEENGELCVKCYFDL